MASGDSGQVTRAKGRIDEAAGVKRFAMIRLAPDHASGKADVSPVRHHLNQTLTCIGGDDRVVVSQEDIFGTMIERPLHAYIPSTGGTDIGSISYDGYALVSLAEVVEQTLAGAVLDHHNLEMGACLLHEGLDAVSHLIFRPKRWDDSHN